MSVITNKWNDGSGDSISIESPSFQGNQTVKISSPVQKGTFDNSSKEKQVEFAKPVQARYIRFTALSEQNGQDFASGAEITILAE